MLGQRKKIRVEMRESLSMPYMIPSILTRMTWLLIEATDKWARILFSCHIWNNENAPSERNDSWFVFECVWAERVVWLSGRLESAASIACQRAFEHIEANNWASHWHAEKQWMREICIFILITSSDPVSGTFHLHCGATKLYEKSENSRLLRWQQLKPKMFIQRV